MKKTKTPDWLIHAQNKSWEPEILISGITLTFLFLLSDYIYNLFAMLIQDFGVTGVLGKIAYTVSIIVLSGLKIILITHLILRGIWTGLIGLSYAFPDGVNKDNLPEKEKNFVFVKPEILVIKVERICSLLFAFIFSSITLVIAFFFLFIPINLLYMTGLNLSHVQIIITYVLIPGTFIVGIRISILEKKKRQSKQGKRPTASFLNNLFEIYLSNIGRKIMLLIFISYFIIVTLFSLPAISKFQFKNNIGVEVPYKANILDLKNDHYENLRNQELRIQKATINQFRVTSNSLELFISL